MVWLDWIAQNWFDLLQSVGIAGSLLFTGFSLRIDTRVRRVQNLLTLTRQHREIWVMLYSRPELSRILEKAPDLQTHPISGDEELFVKFLIFHLSNTHRAMVAGFFIGPERLRDDIHGFFSLPIPRAVWDRIRPLQDSDFVEFVESCLKNR